MFKLDAGKYGWEYVSVVPDSSFNQIGDPRLRALTVSCWLFPWFLAAVLAYYLTRRESSSINNKLSGIIRFRGKTSARCLHAGCCKDEYKLYHTQYSQHVYGTKLPFKLQLSGRKFKQQAAELLTLQSQINPHFLNNIWGDNILGNTSDKL